MVGRATLELVLASWKGLRGRVSLEVTPPDEEPLDRYRKGLIDSHATQSVLIQLFVREGIVPEWGSLNLDLGSTASGPCNLGLLFLLSELWFPHLQNGDRGQKPPPGERVRWHKHAQSLAWRPVREHHVENVKPQTPHSGGGGRSFAAGGALGPAVFTDSFVSI